MKAPVEHQSSTGQESQLPVLELDEVAVEFRPRKSGHRHEVVRALDGVSISATSGQTVGVVGESGSGKSTMARAMLRVLRPASGRVLWGGVDIAEMSEKEIRPRRRQIQMVFQDPFSSLDPRQTIGRILTEPLATHGLAEGAQAREEVLEALDSVSLPASSIERYPHEFSGGQRQRIAIARALMSRPDLVVCDEPVSALDVSVQAQVLEVLAAIQRDRGVGYVFIAHDLAVVSAVADEVNVMYSGAIVESGPAHAVLDNPLHPYTAGLVASVPSVRLGNPEFARAHDISGEPADPAHRPSGCRFAQRCWLKREVADSSLCESVDPELLSTDDGRSVACHFVGGQSVSISTPSR